jgi:hypothetical protein
MKNLVLFATAAMLLDLVPLAFAGVNSDSFGGGGACKGTQAGDQMRPLMRLQWLDRHSQFAI